jgi:AraC-like DNA-binding protein
MQVSVFAPHPELAPFVHVFRVVEAAEESTRVLLPDIGITIGIRFGGSAALLETDRIQPVPNATFSGFRATARHMRTSAGGGVVLAAFHPAGAARFFAQPLHELFGATVALDSFLPRSEIARAEERIRGAKTHCERVTVLEQMLLQRVRPEPPDQLVRAAVAAIRDRKGALRIADLARELGVNIDGLEKRFRRAVGGTPKQLASIWRLKHAVEAHHPGKSLAALALEAGYCDQSHLSRELRAVTGQSPQRFFAAGAHCS